MARSRSRDGKAHSSESRIDRRHFLKAAGGTVATAVAAGAIPFAESKAYAQRRWDHETDVVVIGSGAAALAGAIMAAESRAQVLILESAPVVGGTTARSGGGYWIPNNRFMRASKLEDPREDALRYMARYGWTHLYNPDDSFLGLPENTYELLVAYYDKASPAVEALAALGALQSEMPFLAYDYFDTPENKATAGRLIFVKPVAGSTLIGGAEMIRQMKAWLDQKRVPVLLAHRATRLVVTRKREVIGVEATTDEGQTVAIRARKAVHFGSGGFTLNPELNLAFQRGPVFGSCGPMTNQGDFIYMATEVGAKLGNMQNGWHFQLVLDQVLQAPALATDVWNIPGDSMIVVSKYGKRVVNEKRSYTDRTEVHFVYDPVRCEWTNLVLFMVFDQRVLDLSSSRYPHPLPPRGASAPYILKGSTFEELASAISARLAEFAPRIGGFKLDGSFAANLAKTVARFNRFAQTGNDEEFQRGAFNVDMQKHATSSGTGMVDRSQR